MDINGNRLIKAHDRFINVTKGSISNVKLKKESDAQATLSFGFKMNEISRSRKIRAKIMNKELHISCS